MPIEVHHASFRNAINSRLREVVKRTLKTDAEHHFSVHHSFADPNSIRYAVGPLLRGDSHRIDGNTASILRSKSKYALPSSVLSGHTHPVPVSNRYLAKPSLADLNPESKRAHLNLIATVSPQKKKVILLFYKERANSPSQQLKEDIADAIKTAETQNEVNRLLSMSGYAVLTLTKPRGNVSLTLSEARKIASHFQLREMFETNPF